MSIKKKFCFSNKTIYDWILEDTYYIVLHICY